MSNLEIKNFAKQIGLSEKQIIDQFKNIGIYISNTKDLITEKQKKDLLVYLENKYTKKEKIIKNKRWLTLKRKKITQIKIKGKKTLVITKRNHTYVKNEMPEKKIDDTIIKNKNIINSKQLNNNNKQQILENKPNNIKKEYNNIIKDKIINKKDSNNNNTNTILLNTINKDYKSIGNDNEIQKENNNNNIVKNNFSIKNNNLLKNEKNDNKTNKTSENKIIDKKNYSKNIKISFKKKKDTVVYKKNAYKTDKFKKKRSRNKEEKNNKFIDRGKRQNNKIFLDKDGEILVYGSKKYINKNIKQSLNKNNPHSFEKPQSPVVREVKIEDSITVSDLAKKLSVKTAEVIKHLLNLGIMATINQNIDQDTALLVIEETGHKGIAHKTTNLDDLKNIYKSEKEKRSPVVTIMGHVDHGKTSLLDFIRKSNIVNSESGNITQHIGAYRVKNKKGNITFLDTPGHSAFTAMRARGAECTDLIVLVIAADDGIMPQTLEAINHAKAAKVPILVAINKIDKPGSDIKRIQNELAQHQLIPEEWGGDVIFTQISAKHGTNIDVLLDAILLQTDVLELKAYVSGPAEGIVIESRIEKGQGVVATLLVKNGKLEKGNIILAGQEYGKVRILKDENMNELKHALPSVPVEILGLSGPPLAGDKFLVLENEAKAKEIAKNRKQKNRELRLYSNNENKITNVISNMTDNKVILPIILKTDVQGSAEAIKESLNKLSNKKIKILIVSIGVGNINESDVNLTIASKGILIGFNVRADAKSRKLANAENIKLNYFSIIYDLINEIEKIVSGKNKVKYKEKIIGLADVKNIFKVSKIGVIAGCKVIQGNIKKGELVRILRNNKVIYKGNLESLRRFKNDVSEVKYGNECGISIKNYNNLKVDDQIESYTKSISEDYDNINEKK